MKYRFIKSGAVFMAALMAVLGTSPQQTRAAAVRAGVSAALTECFSEGTKAVTVSQGSAAVHTVRKIDVKSENSDKKSNKSDSKKKIKSLQKKAEEDKTICGYTNLGIANVDNYLNIRQEPGEDGKIVGKLPADAGCEILETENGWHHIRSGKVSGYVKSDYIITGQEAEKLADKLKKTVATVNSVTVYIREQPNTDCTILTIVTADEELEVVEEGKDWVEVKLDDENGFVSAQYVDLSEELKKAMVYTETERSAEVSDNKYSLAQKALSYVGGRYVWGGTSLTNGVDCSGFTMRIMAMYGVYLPHSSRGQAGYGRSVSTSELQPGDLIFYGSGSSISHVAIYIGGGQIVHASNSRDGIKVSNAFYRTPICCRRML